MGLNVYRYHVVPVVLDHPSLCRVTLAHYSRMLRVHVAFTQFSTLESRAIGCRVLVGSLLLYLLIVCILPWNPRTLGFPVWTLGFPVCANCKCCHVRDCDALLRSIPLHFVLCESCDARVFLIVKWHLRFWVVLYVKVRRCCSLATLTTFIIAKRHHNNDAAG
jgi:hypothetical protein